MENGNTWKIFERAVYEIIIVAHPANAGIGEKSGNNRIMIDYFFIRIFYS
jgi:hypothetical protein